MPQTLSMQFRDTSFLMQMAGWWRRASIASRSSLGPLLGHRGHYLQGDTSGRGVRAHIAISLALSALVAAALCACSRPDRLAAQAPAKPFRSAELDGTIEQYR